MQIPVFIVMTPMRINRNGNLVRLMPGDQVPEAKSWPVNHQWFASGSVKRVLVDVPRELLEELLEKATEPAKRKGKAA